jgi:hypothetical protein
VFGSNCIPQSSSRLSCLLVLDPCFQLNQQSSIVEINHEGENMYMLHQQTLSNWCKFNLCLEVTAFPSTVLGRVVAISVRSLLPIKPTVHYCRNSPWSGQHVSATPAHIIKEEQV